jgi:hypothetical protein
MKFESFVTNTHGYQLERFTGCLNLTLWVEISLSLSASQMDLNCIARDPIIEPQIAVELLDSTTW